MSTYNKKPAWFKPHPIDPNTFKEVRLTTHEGRTYAAHLSLSGQNWRNGTSHQNASVKGYNPKKAPPDFDHDFKEFISFVIFSKGLFVLYQDSRIVEANKKYKDPRKHTRSWNVTNLEEMSPIQLHHAQVISHYLVPQYHWEIYPPYVTEAGELPVYMRPRENRHDSGDDEFDEG